MCVTLKTLRLLAACLPTAVMVFSVPLRAQSDSLLQNYKRYSSLKEQGKYDQAIPIAEQTLVQFGQEFGKAHHYYGVGLHDLGLLYRYTAQFDKALDCMKRSVENAAVSIGKDHQEYGIRLNDLAGIYKEMGQYEKALPLYYKALDNAEKSLGKSHAFYGTYLNDLAALYYLAGQYEKALPIYLEAKNNAEKNYGKSHREYGTRLNNLAALYKAMGLFDKALPLYTEALENTEKAAGKDHPVYGSNLNNLAGLYEDLGQYEKAESLYLASLTNTEHSLGKHHPYYGIRLNNLATLYETMGQYKKALPLLLEALDNTEKSLGKSHPLYGSRLNGLAGHYESIGDFQQALPLYLLALENTEKSVGKSHPDYGNSLSNLALIYRRTGQYEKALPLYLEALQNAENSLGKQHKIYGNRLLNLASFYTQTGQPALGLPLFLEYWSNLKNQISGGFSFLSENEKNALIQTMEKSFHTLQSQYLQFSKDSKSVAGYSYDLEMATKGMILASGINMQSAIRSSGDSLALAMYDDWLLLRGAIAREQSMPLEQQRNDLSEIVEQAEKMEAQLARRSTELTGRKEVGMVDWKQVQQALGDQDVAVEFTSFRYGHGNYWTDSTVYMALVLRKNDEMPKMVPLCTEKQLDSLLRSTATDDPAFVSGLYRGGRTHTSRQNIAHTRKLYDLVWKPFDTLLRAGDHVYFSPSGRLHQLAFAAIPYKNQTLLSDRYRLEQVSSTAALTVEEVYQAPKQLALVGGVDYENYDFNNAVDSDSVVKAVSGNVPSTGSEDTWSYLEGTLNEVSRIEAIAATANIQCTVLKGNTASEERIKAMSGKASPDVLHIATHGFFFPEPGKNADTNTQSNASAQVFRQSKNALNRSGLLLSGANRSWHDAAASQGHEDGIYTALEATYVPLFNTELVVLSACETGLGDIKGSEGVYGLQRAFKAAGAKHMMMSLWKVPDSETAEFMTIFYGHYLGEKPVTAAFQQTQSEMRDKYRKDPYKWAAFVLIR